MLSRHRLERGAFTNTQDLDRATLAYIAETNVDPRPFAWTKTTDRVLASFVRFANEISNSVHPHVPFPGREA